MNKKKILVLLLLLIVLFVVLSKILKYKPKEYIKDNETSITNTSEKLLEISGERTIVYFKKSDCPEEVDLSDVYKNLDISKISVEKNKEKYGEGYEDCVRFFLKNKPEDDEYHESGIYYSPSSNAIDFYGKIAEEDNNGIFLYDGRPKDGLVIYKSERISDNWFYFERTVW